MDFVNNKILPIVVIYKCQLDEARSYQTVILHHRISEFVVYDNSPADYIQKEGMVPVGAHYYHDIHNSGLSKAYNYGAKIAKERGYSWLLLLDQDTDFPDNAWECYVQGVKYGKLIVPNVVLDGEHPFSPCQPHWYGMKPVILPEGSYSLYQYNVINSGCCLPLAHFESAGGYKEDVMLDFSDYQFQHRLRKVYDTFYVLPFRALQDFSNDETDETKLMNRFLLYLKGALNYESDGLYDHLIFNIQVLKHSLALTLRTRNMNFMVCYFKKYLLHR